MGVNTAGVNVFAGAPPLSYPASTGRVFYVGSTAVPGGVAGSDTSGAHGDSPQRPFLTIDYAIGQCVASRNDVIYVLPGHAETLSAAGGITADIAGISIIGLGNGRNRPTISVLTAVGTDINIDAANITIENIYFDVTGVDAVTAFIDVNAADCTFRNCEFLMADAGGQATRCFVGATEADRLRVLNCTFRSTTAGAASAIQLVGTADGTEIAHNYIYGDFSVAAIENATLNVCTNVWIHHNYIQNDNNTNFAIELVSACTGVIEYNTCVTDAVATAVDWGACAAFQNFYWDDGDTDTAGTAIPTAQTTGGMDLQTIADRLGADADTDAVAAMLGGAAGIATIPAAAVPANAVNVFELLRSIWANQAGTAANENGIATFPAAADPANNVSMAEVIRSLWEKNTGGAAANASNPLLGLRVNKTAATLPATTTQNIFTVGGGRCMITSLTGEVTTVVQAQLCNLSVNLVTTVGGDIVLASVVDINADEAGTLYVVEGDGTALVPQSSGAVLWSSGSGPMIVAEGTINIQTSATNTGATSWECWYIPLDSGATIVTA